VRHLPHPLVHPLDRPREAGRGEERDQQAGDPGLGAHLVGRDLALDERGALLADPRCRGEGVHRVADQVREERGQHHQHRDQREQPLRGDQHAPVDELDPHEVADQPAQDRDLVDQVLCLLLARLVRRGEALTHSCDVQRL